MLSLLTSYSTDLQTGPAHYHWQSIHWYSLHIIACLNYIYLVIAGAEAVRILSNRASQVNVHMVNDGTWPPGQPTCFIPLLLIHHKDDRTAEEVTTIAELMHTGDIDKVAVVTGEQPTVERDKVATVSSEQPTVKRAKLDSNQKIYKMLDNSRATDKIDEILAPLENSTKSAFILIEGAPGIGKSVLLKEIAYKWGDNKQLLKNYELVLLVLLRDPSLRQVSSVDDLLRLFCKGDKNPTPIVSACAEYLLDNSGKTLTLLLDGYDEYPRDLQEASLIADILKRQVLPLCGLVVSSRPHASQQFHKQASIRVDILGFTETEREHYIKQALPNQPQKIKELTQYLHQRSSVDSLCFIPFNMVILLYLYKQGIPLPNNTTELYHHFILSTINRHLIKLGNSLPDNINNLTDLPEPYNRIIQQLSKLSLEALNNNKLIFTLDEITAACPEIAATPGGINGFGLLQAVQHFGLYATKKTSLNFIHFTVQEYLASHYISYLPPDEEFRTIKANFWSDIHFNMFTMYIALTKGRRSSFKKFLSSGNEAITISDEFLKDQSKSLRLYRCFKEADNTRLCDTIERAEIFHDRKINLNLHDTAFTASDIECVSLFLASSFNKEWELLNLISCYIQDKGLNILWRGLRHITDITINTLWLSSNGLTVQSSSLISELTVRWKIKMLVIAGNKTIGENQQLYNILSNPSGVLEILDMGGTKLSSTAATDLFTLLRNNHKLKKLYIASNAITDDACDAITAALKSNGCLIKLSMHDNPLSSEAIVNIVQCLEDNDTLQVIGLPDCSKATQENIRALQEVVNNKRASRGCQVKLEVKFNYLLG